MRPIGVERHGRLCNSKPTALTRDDESQEEARNAKPTALHRDEESSNSGYTGSSPALGIARDFPKAGIKALRWP